jgi:hypothetical protein
MTPENCICLEPKQFRIEPDKVECLTCGAIEFSYPPKYSTVQLIHDGEKWKVVNPEKNKEDI